MYGETGSGKEVFAKAMHRSSERAGRPFVALNCASIPETLIESELFGYKAGAFTGAARDGRRGKIFLANGGTLFLDEIGDMPVHLQARLLRALEEREVLPLGGDEPIKVDIRLISATHCNLTEKIKTGEFRPDLYYRLHGFALTLPPLRERGDRRELIRRVLAEEAEGSPIEIDEAALDRLDRYSWPGNLRELRNVLRTVLALREGQRGHGVRSARSGAHRQQPPAAGAGTRQRTSTRVRPVTARKCRARSARAGTGPAALEYHQRRAPAQDQSQHAVSEDAAARHPRP